MNLIFTFFLVIFFYILGFSVLSKLNKQFTKTENIGISYGIGIGIITLQLFFYSVLHVPWTKLTIFLPWIIFILYFIWQNRKFKLLSFKKFKFLFHKPLINYILIILVIITALYVIFEGTLRPVDSWDAWANWFLGGKAFFVDGFVNPKYITYINNSYPQSINLLVSSVYIFLGHIDDKAALLPFVFFYISLLFALYGSIKKSTNSRISLFFVFLFAAVQNVIRHAGRFDVGDADLALGYYFYISVISLLSYLKNNSTRSLFLVSMLTGLSALVKSEGVPFFLIVNSILIFNILKERKYQKFIYMLVGVVILASWEIFSFYYKLPQNPYVRLVFPISRIPIILLTMFKELFDVQRWNLLWIVFLITLIKSRFSSQTKIVLLVLGMQWVFYIGIYITTPLDTVSHINNTFDRLMLHLAPMALFFISLNLFYLLKHLNKNHWIRSLFSA